MKIVNRDYEITLRPNRKGYIMKVEKQFNDFADSYTFKKRHILYAIVGLMVLGIFTSWLGVFSTVATAPARVINKTLETIPEKGPFLRLLKSNSEIFMIKRINPAIITI